MSEHPFMARLARLRRIGLTPGLWRHLASHHPELHGLTDSPTPERSDLTDASRLGHQRDVNERPSPPAASPLQRVVEVQREHLLLHDGDGLRRARVLPRVLAALANGANALAVGDWVQVAADDHGGLWVQQRLQPFNQLTRRQHDGRDKVARAVIVSNVDTALLAMGLDLDFNLRRLQRYATLVRLAGVQAVVVLTKADQCADAELPAQRVAQVQQCLGPAVPVLAVDSAAPQTAQALAPLLGEGQTLVLLGASGVGKSTLTNGLCAGAQQATGGTRSGDGRGRHTTTVRSLHRTAQGACIIDTPGLRTWRLDTDEAALDQVFDDVSGLAAACRFRDCRHQDEPGCAVRAGVPAERLRHFHKLRREAERDGLSALERQRQLSEWKARGRAGRARAEAKRG